MRNIALLAAFKLGNLPVNQEQFALLGTNRINTIWLMVKQVWINEESKKEEDVPPSHSE